MALRLPVAVDVTFFEADDAPLDEACLPELVGRAKELLPLDVAFDEALLLHNDEAV